jgi:hypothetical protein
VGDVRRVGLVVGLAGLAVVAGGGRTPSDGQADIVNSIGGSVVGS